MGTGTSEDVFNLLVIKGPTPGEGIPGIEPGSLDPQSSPPSLHHRGGQGEGYSSWSIIRKQIRQNKNLATKRVIFIILPKGDFNEVQI